MNNFEKFYNISGKAIEIFSKAIKKENDNFEKEKKKILNNLKDYSEEDKLHFWLTWQILIDYTMLALNREKVENDVNINWDNYKPMLFTSHEYCLGNPLPSKIPYFKEWLRVVDCKDRYLTEDSRFWIKRVRNSFLHGNFEYDYDRPDQQLIRIFEGSPSSTDVKMNIKNLGLHEFIEDNFHNIDHQEFGIASSYIDILLIISKRINNREELKHSLRKELFILKRKVDENYYYNGNDIINSNTGEKARRAKKFVKLSFEESGPVLQTKEFVNPNADIHSLDMSFIDDLVWILENKYNIYNCKKQKKAICQAIKQYGFPMDAINRLLHEFNSFTGGVIYDKKDYKEINFDFTKMSAVLYNLGDNIENAFVILKLCRMMYRLQNKNFEKINNNLFDCKEYMTVPDYACEEMQKRIDKHKGLITDSAINEEVKERSATNSAYLEVLRNAMAHGNIDIHFLIKNNQIFPIFKLTDDWINKNGEREIIEIRSTAKLLDFFLDMLEFVADNNFLCPLFDKKSINKEEVDKSLEI